MGRASEAQAELDRAVRRDPFSLPLKTVGFPASLPRAQRTGDPESPLLARPGIWRRTPVPGGACGSGFGGACPTGWAHVGIAPRRNRSWFAFSNSQSGGTLRHMASLSSMPVSSLRSTAETGRPHQLRPRFPFAAFSAHSSRPGPSFAFGEIRRHGQRRLARLTFNWGRHIGQVAQRGDLSPPAATAS
jgi:hypothetical protein